MHQLFKRNREFEPFSVFGILVIAVLVGQGDRLTVGVYVGRHFPRLRR